MFAQAPSDLVDAFSEEVHVGGNSDNGFFTLHDPHHFSKFRAVHANLGLNLLQIGWSNGRLAERGFDFCDDCLLIALETNLVSDF